MKKLIIVALVCLNLALVAALFHVLTPQAKAQSRRGAGNYVMITAQDGTNSDAVYIVNTSSTGSRLAAFTYDKTNNRLIPHLGRELDRDFTQGR